ncbi:hypothetical protein DFH07DRAFT_1062313 [Mycena maculata]|uniref:Uncharacterized protein n=1 Tax=Mycena maculata TaxID=230809 RepID=A0AAD7ISI1_9AGAR|nr:hypothetical protein DFH07DRAFT_1062313 [Mycena maculata]
MFQGSGSSSSSSALGRIGKLSSKVSSSSSSSRKLKAANEESNKGMRPPPQEKAKGKGKSKQSNPSTNLFRVVSVHVLTCGTKFIDGVLQLPEGHQLVPSRIEIDNATLRGHAVVRAERGIEFDRTCDHREFTDALEQLLPHPFAYFDRLRDESADDKPCWYLAAVAGKRLQIVPRTHPTGADADYHKGNMTSSFRQNRLWIISRDLIPADIVETWGEVDALAAFRDPTSGLGTRDSNTSESEDDAVSHCPSPEPAPCRSKRGLSSTEGPPKKKKRSCTLLAAQPLIINPHIKASSSGKEAALPDISADNVENEIMNTPTPCIDLTEDTVGSGRSTPLFLRAVTPPPKPNPVNPVFSNEFKVDPTLGDPYADREYNF